MNTNAPRITVVDDDEAVRDSLHLLLESYGMTVDTCASAREFLARRADCRADCLVLDMHLPDIDGFDLLRHLAEAGLVLPTIMITGRGDATLKASAAAIGVLDFLEKPFTGDRLLKAIERVVGNRETRQLTTTVGA